MFLTFTSLQFDEYPKLKEEVLFLMDIQMMRNEDQTLKFLYTYLDFQSSYVIDMHPKFRNSIQFSQNPNGESGSYEAATTKVEDGPPKNEELVPGQV